jgi:hypothetical protein
VDKFSGMLPFLAIGVLDVANLVAAVGALRGASRAEELGEGRFKLLREERRVLLDELEPRERLEAQKRANSSCACSRTWSLNENSSSSVRRLSWSARDARTTIAKASA